MNTTIAVNASKDVPHSLSSVQDIPLTNIQESGTNPRRQFNETKLAELADNIRQHGVLQPVLVRPSPDGKTGFGEFADACGNSFPSGEFRSAVAPRSRYEDTPR